MQADPNEGADHFDVFVIGGGGTGSEIAFRLARTTRLRVGLAERDKLGGECNHYGCVPTKVMLRSANIAAIGRDAARFGVRIPSVEVDIQRFANGPARSSHPCRVRGLRPSSDSE
jgi:pyruvate/2-oxoglutarate dehydrogenase complex dihydrolipoamide dehydrogenase (E3) component